MGEILICTMGLSPGVVTKMTQYLQDGEDEKDETKRKKREFAEVWVVFTSSQVIMNLYNDILRCEFDKQLGLGGKYFPKVFSPADVQNEQQIKQFFTELAILLKQALAPDGNVVHLCISGGRKSMTYASAMAIEQAAGELGKAAERLHVWHVQLGREEEPTQEDVERLLQDYRNGWISSDDRQRILYPRNAQIIKVPFLLFQQRQRVVHRQDGPIFVPEEPR